MSQHVLWLPEDPGATPLLYTFKSDSHTPVQALLEESGHGFYVHFDIDVDGEHGGRIAFLVDDQTPRNKRAEDALAFLTDGTHMQVTGNACLVGLSPELVDYIAKGDY